MKKLRKNLKRWGGMDIHDLFFATKLFESD
jgi:hypothetical protein